jgi:hypothetical protein
MIKNIRFTFVCNQEEYDLIAALACMHLRSKSDVVRNAVIRLANDENIQNGAEYLKKCEGKFAYDYFSEMDDR